MMRVDGVEVAARGSVLEACRAAGVAVPAFCHDPRLSRGGHCRSCMVEAGGRLLPACTTPARDGLEVTTGGERVLAYRRDLGELMLAESSPGREVGVALAAWGADGTRYGRAQARHAPDRSHPHLRVHLDRCILCRRCVRACEEIQGQFVYAIEGRDAGTRLGWGGGDFASSACVACGACVSPARMARHSNPPRAATSNIRIATSPAAPPRASTPYTTMFSSHLSFSQG